MLVVIQKKYDDLVRHSEMFSIILKLICLFQITKGIYLLISGINNLHIVRMELHIDIFVEPLFFHHSSHFYHQSIQMVFLICQYLALAILLYLLSVVTLDFVEEIDCHIRKSRQNDFEFLSK